MEEVRTNRMTHFVVAARSTVERARQARPVTTFTGREPWKIAGVPIFLITGWWALSLTIWAIGYPIPYVRVNLPLVIVLVGACIIAATAGFLVVARALPGNVAPPVTRRRLPIPVLVGVIAMVVLLVPWAEYYSGYHLWQLGSALADQGGAYAAAAKRVAEGTAARTGIVLAQTALAPFTLAVIPVTALAWFERRRHLLLLVLALCVQAVMSFLVGRDFYVMTAALLVLAAWVLSRVRRRMAPTWRGSLVFAGSVGLFVVAFTARKLSRGALVSSQPLCLPGVAHCSAAHAPSLWDSLSTYVASYMSQSMEGLGRAMSGVWAFGGGYRHSPVLTTIADSVGLPHARVITDQLQSHGWSATDYWSTGWAWMANDVPWFVVPVVVAALAALLGLTWRRAVRDADWLSVTLFSHGWLTMFFLAQNNVLTIDGPTYFGFLGLCVVFAVREVLRRSRRRRSSTSGADVAA